MRRIVLAFAMCAALSAAAGAQTLSARDRGNVDPLLAKFKIQSAGMSQFEKEIIYRELVACEALVRGDVAAFRRYAADDGVSIDNAEPQRVSQMIPVIFSKEYRLISATMEEPAVRRLGRDGAILSYYTSITDSLRGRQESRRTINTTVFQRRGKGWIAVHHHSHALSPGATESGRM